LLELHVYRDGARGPSDDKPLEFELVWVGKVSWHDIHFKDWLVLAVNLDRTVVEVRHFAAEHFLREVNKCSTILVDSLNRGHWSFILFGG